MTDRRKVTGAYSGEEIDVHFAAEQVRDHYGVPGSLVWWATDPDSITVTALSILGVDVAIDALPAPLAERIYELADEVEWEVDDD